MPTDLITLGCIVESALILILVVVSFLSRRSSTIRRSLDVAIETTRGTRYQWLAILCAILGANAGYLVLIGSYIFIVSPQAPPEAPGFWSISAIVAYLMCGIPIYFALGAVVGLLVSRYAKRNSLTNSAALTISFTGSAAIGAFLAIPIYFIGLMGAAL